MSPLFNPSALDRDQLASASFGIISRGFVAAPNQFTTNNTLASQTLLGCLFGLRAGDVVTGAAVNIGVAGVAAVPTSLLAVILSAAGTVLFTSEEKNNATWVAGTGWRTVTYTTSSYTVPANGGYYIGWWQNGAFATPLQLKRTNSGAAAGDSGPLGSGAAIAFTSAGLASVSVNDTPALAAAANAQPAYPVGVAVTP